MSTHPSTSVTLAEDQSKALLSGFGVPFAPEAVVHSPADAVSAAATIGYPVVVKLNGERIAHKTERGLVKLNLGDAEAVTTAATTLLSAATPEDGDVSLLVAPMLSATREFIAGISTDPQFGTTVVLGVGGVLTEAIADVSIRLLPITDLDAQSMINDLRSQPLLGEFRGEPAVDRDALGAVLMALSDAAAATTHMLSADLNPLMIVDGMPIAVDALVEVRES